MLRQLCEFSALLQLGATFNFGCIALSGKSFAKSMSNFFFKVDSTIDKEFDSIKHQISTDEESIKTLAPRKIDGKDLTVDIDKLRSNINELKLFRDQELKKVKKKIDSDYIPVCLDDMCLFLGFYSVYELILIFALKMEYSLIILFSALNALCLIVILWLFICEGFHYRRVFLQKRTQRSFLQVPEHKSYPFLSMAVLILSTLFYLLNETVFRDLIPYYHWYATFNLFIGILLPFIGLFVYYFYIQFLSIKAHKYIRNSIRPITERFNEIHRRKDNIDAILTYFEKDSISRFIASFNADSNQASKDDSNQASKDDSNQASKDDSQESKQ